MHTQLCIQTKCISSLEIYVYYISVSISQTSTAACTKIEREREREYLPSVCTKALESLDLDNMYAYMFEIHITNWWIYRSLRRLAPPTRFPSLYSQVSASLCAVGACFSYILYFSICNCHARQYIKKWCTASSSTIVFFASLHAGVYNVLCVQNAHVLALVMYVFVYMVTRFFKYCYVQFFFVS